MVIARGGELNGNGKKTLKLEKNYTIAGNTELFKNLPHQTQKFPKSLPAAEVCRGNISQVIVLLRSLVFQ